MDFMVICLVLLVNGCMIYQGYLFVNGVLLNEFGMCDYLVMLMCDVNLMWLIQMQVQGCVGNVLVQVLDKGVDVVCVVLVDLKVMGVCYVVLDVLSDVYLEIMGWVVVDMVLVIGGLGLVDGMVWVWVVLDRCVVVEVKG